MRVVLPEPFSPTSASLRRAGGGSSRPRARSIAARIEERHVLEADAVARLRADRALPGGAVTSVSSSSYRFDRYRLSSYMPPTARQRRRQRRLALLEDQDVHGHVAQGDVAAAVSSDDPGVGAVEGGGRHEAEHEAPAVRAAGSGCGPRRRGGGRCRRSGRAGVGPSRTASPPWPSPRGRSPSRDRPAAASPACASGTGGRPRRRSGSRRRTRQRGDHQDRDRQRREPEQERARR